MNELNNKQDGGWMSYWVGGGGGGGGGGVDGWINGLELLYSEIMTLASEWELYDNFNKATVYTVHNGKIASIKFNTV